MKKLVGLLLVGASLQAMGQTTPKPNFCGQDLEVAAGCSAPSSYQLQCGPNELTWAYIDFSVLPTAAEQFLRPIEKKNKKAEKMPLVCLLQGVPAKGYKLSYVTETGLQYQLVATGIVKGQPVLVQLTTDMDIVRNEDVPAFARQIFQLAK